MRSKMLPVAVTLLLSMLSLSCIPGSSTGAGNSGKPRSMGLPSKRNQPWVPPNMSSGTVRNHFIGKGLAEYLDIAPDGTWLVATGAQSVTIYDTSTGRKIKSHAISSCKTGWTAPVMHDRSWSLLVLAWMHHSFDSNLTARC